MANDILLGQRTPHSGVGAVDSIIAHHNELVGFDLKCLGCSKNGTQGLMSRIMGIHAVVYLYPLGLAAVAANELPVAVYAGKS